MVLSDICIDTVGFKYGRKVSLRDRRVKVRWEVLAASPSVLSHALYCLLGIKNQEDLFVLNGGLFVDSYIISTQLSGDFACTRSCMLPWMKS